MSQFEFDRWARGRFTEFPEYADQLACYMEATGLTTAEYYVKNRSSGYVDKSIIYYFGDGLAKRMLAIIAKLDTVANWLARKELPPIAHDITTTQCRRCTYKYLCIKTKEDMTIQDEAALFAAAQDWRKGKALENEARQLIEGAKKVFEEHTIASGLQQWHFDDLIISNIIVKEHEIPARIQKEYSYIRIEDTRKEA